jgi:hypothetical protein
MEPQSTVAILISPLTDYMLLLCKVIASLVPKRLSLLRGWKVFNFVIIDLSEEWMFDCRQWQDTSLLSKASRPVLDPVGLYVVGTAVLSPER